MPFFDLQTFMITYEILIIINDILKYTIRLQTYTIHIYIPTRVLSVSTHPVQFINQFWNSIVLAYI